MPAPTVAYLGPEGTFSELVARKRFGRAARLVPQASIYDVFEFVRKNRRALGIVPIENSSGGTIYETVDCLVEEGSDTCILEDLSLNVRLALMGRRGAKIKTVYSHFVPMRHCEMWLRKHLPEARRAPVASTAKAAEMAAADEHAAALGTREAAKRNRLDVLEFPVHTSVPNITQFYCIGQQPGHTLGGDETTIVVTLQNRPGSLVDLLACFRDEKVNLTRLLSRPIIGQPKAYLFFIDIQGTPAQAPVGRALIRAREAASTLRVLGVYPLRRPYVS